MGIESERSSAVELGTFTHETTLGPVSEGLTIISAQGGGAET